MAEFDNDFMHAWYKLTTRDMGPHSRCLGPMVPPEQPWQYPLPLPTTNLADFVQVKQQLSTLVWEAPDLRGLFTRLAWRCSATFRATDYLGGCNGARVRLAPQKDWPVNSNLDLTLEMLQPIKDTFGSGLSWSDLIVLGGSTALEQAAGTAAPFCPGRTDGAEDGGASDFLQPRVTGEFNDTLAQLKEAAVLMGLTQAEFAALNGAGYAIGDKYCTHKGLFCKRDVGDDEPITLDNRFFTTLLGNTWEEHIVPGTDRHVYRAVGSDRIMFATDLWYRSDGRLRAIAEEYAMDNAKFVQDVVSAWTKITTADRFAGPVENHCDQPGKSITLPPVSSLFPAPT